MYIIYIYETGTIHYACRCHDCVCIQPYQSIVSVRVIAPNMHRPVAGSGAAMLTWTLCRHRALRPTHPTRGV